MSEENKIPSKIQSGLLDTFRPDAEQVMESIQKIVLQELLVAYSNHLVDQFMEHGMNLDETGLDETQIVRIKQQIGVDAIRAACMQDDYWANVDERMAECFPRFQELSRDSKFVDLVVAQKSDEISAYLQESVSKYCKFPTFEQEVDEEAEDPSLICACDGCDAVSNAEEDWIMWKPYDKTSAHFKETIDKISSSL